MSSLKELQESFQRGILASDDTILAEIKDSPKQVRKVLLGVYRHAMWRDLPKYWPTTTSNCMPMSAMLALPSWRGLISRPIPRIGEAHGTSGAICRNSWRVTQASRHPELAEIASLEKALAGAFDGPEAEPLKLAELAMITPEHWTRLVFTPHPTPRRLTFATNAADIWSAVRDESALPCPRQLPDPQAILVWHRDATAHFRPLGPEEAMMWNETAAGTRFGVLCEMVAIYGGEDGADFRAASYLKGLGRHGEPGRLPACGLARSQPAATTSGAGNNEPLRPASR